MYCLSEINNLNEVSKQTNYKQTNNLVYIEYILHFICTLYRPDCLFTYFMSIVYFRKAIHIYILYILYIDQIVCLFVICTNKLQTNKQSGLYRVHIKCKYVLPFWGNTYLHFICTLYRPDCLFVCNLFVYLLHVNCLFYVLPFWNKQFTWSK
jgi:hypothetical protein